MAKLVRERGKGVLKALTILIVALLALADTAESFRYSLSDLHYEYASAHFSSFILPLTQCVLQYFILSMFRQIRSKTELRKRRAAEVDDDNTYRFKIIHPFHSVDSTRIRKQSASNSLIPQ